MLVVPLSPQITHEVSLDDALSAHMELDVFKFDPEYEAHEAQYAAIKRELLGEESEEEGKCLRSGVDGCACLRVVARGCACLCEVACGCARLRVVARGCVRGCARTFWHRCTASLQTVTRVTWTQIPLRTDTPTQSFNLLQCQLNFTPCLALQAPATKPTMRGRRAAMKKRARGSRWRAAALRR